MNIDSEVLDDFLVWQTQHFSLHFIALVDKLVHLTGLEQKIQRVDIVHVLLLPVRTSVQLLNSLKYQVVGIRKVRLFPNEGFKAYFA